MRKGMLIGGGVIAALAVTGVAAMIVNSNDKGNMADSMNGGVAMANHHGEDCRVVAANETGFDPATTAVPAREDAGNKQVLKGTAVGAAVGAVSGEVIGGKPGLGAAAGAAAGAAGGEAIKIDRQNGADARYDQADAAYQQQKIAYDAALSECQSRK